MKLNPKETNKGILAIVLLALSFSFIAILPRYFSYSFKLFQQVYLRTITALIFSIFIFRKRIKFQHFFKATKKDYLLLLFRATSYYLLGVSLWAQASIITKISNVSFISSIPISAILGFILLKEKITKKRVLLVLISFIGVLIVSLNNFSITSFGRGEVLILLSTIFLGIGKISRRWESTNLNDRESSIILLFFASLLLFATSQIVGEGIPLSNWNSGIILAVIFGGLVNVGIAFFTTYGYSRVKAVVASNLIQLEIPLIIIFGLIFYQELPGFRELTGGLIIVASAIWMNKLDQKN